MDKKTKFTLIGYTVVELVTAAILFLLNVLDFKVIEETPSLEIWKRVIMSLVVMVIVGGLAHSPIGIWASRKAAGIDDKKK